MDREPFFISALDEQHTLALGAGANIQFVTHPEMHNALRQQAERRLGLTASAGHTAADNDCQGSIAPAPSACPIPESAGHLVYLVAVTATSPVTPDNGCPNVLAVGVLVLPAIEVVWMLALAPINSPHPHFSLPRFDNLGYSNPIRDTAVGQSHLDSRRVTGLQRVRDLLRSAIRTQVGKVADHVPTILEPNDNPRLVGQVLFRLGVKGRIKLENIRPACVAQDDNRVSESRGDTHGGSSTEKVCMLHTINITPLSSGNSRGTTCHLLWTLTHLSLRNDAAALELAVD